MAAADTAAALADAASDAASDVALPEAITVPVRDKRVINAIMYAVPPVYKYDNCIKGIANNSRCVI